MASRPRRRAKPGDDGPSDGPSRPDRRQDLPFVIGVLADLAGQAPVDPSRPPALVAVSHDSLDDFMASLSPVLAFQVADTLKGEGELAIELHFRSMQDFRPDRLLLQVPRLHHLHDTRTGLAALRALLVRDPEADVPEDLVPFDPRTRPSAVAARPAPAVQPGPAAADAPRMRLAAGAFQTHASADGVWSSRVPKPRPVDPAAEPSERGGHAAQLQADAEGIVAADERRAADRAREDPVAEIDRRVDAIDDVLSDQLDALYQAPALRTLEASWRGLDHLLRSTRPCPRVQVQVMVLRRDDLPQQLAAHDPANAWQRCITPARQPVGQAPVSLLLVDHAVGHAPGDERADGLGDARAWLPDLGRQAEADLVPCLVGAAPGLLGLADFGALGAGADLFDALAGAPSGLSLLNAWPALRMVGLALPRFRMRRPFGSKRRRAVGRFVHLPLPSAAGADGPWGSAVWCLGAGLAQAFDRSGGCQDLGVLDGPMAYDPPPRPGGLAAATGPTVTDALLGDAQAGALAGAGLIALRERVGTDQVMLAAAPSLHVPRSDVDDAPLPAPDWLSTLAACRVAQQLRSLIQARPGPFAGPEACAAAVQAWLQPWLAPDGLTGQEVDRDLLDQAVARVQADGQAGWRLQLALTPAQARSRGGPVLLTVVLPADRILATEDPAMPLPDAPAEAALRLRAQASGAGSGRARFLARRVLAERAVAAGQLDVARVVLDELAAQIERHQLPDWEDPQVVLPVWRLLRRVLLTADRSPPADDTPDLLRAQQLLRQICALDPAAALEENH